MIVLKTFINSLGDDSRTDNEIMDEWFCIVRDKTKLARFEKELLARAQELDLEARREHLEEQLETSLSINGETALYFRCIGNFETKFKCRICNLLLQKKLRTTSKGRMTFCMNLHELKTNIHTFWIPFMLIWKSNQSFCNLRNILSLNALPINLLYIFIIDIDTHWKIHLY